MQSNYMCIFSRAASLAIIAVLSGVTIASAATAPIITSVSPSTGTTAGGTSVMITGSGFSNATGVDFGTTPGIITVSSSDTSLSVTSPAMTSAGAQDITVMGPNGTSATSSADLFTYTTPTSASTTTSSSTMPVISNVTVTAIDPTDATINWTTDSSASSQVFYGTNIYYGAMTNNDMTPVTSHSQTLYGLTPATQYHFYVSSASGSSTAATSSDMTFMTAGSSTSSTSTASTASSTPLALTGITTIQSNATGDGTYTDGFQWVLHFSVPTSENSFSMKFADFTNGSGGTIPAASDILFYSPESSNASTQATGFTESNNGYTGFLDLTAASSTAADQNVDVYVDVAVPSGTPTGTYSTTFGALSTTSATTQ